MSDRDRPLLLLDGMSLAFRAFYALSTDIQTSEGVVTNALHGFASMLLTLIKDQNPRALAVAFDLAGGTFRHEMTDDYKGGRAETPVEIEHQFDLIRSLCEVLHIPVIGVPSFEADDVLATLATRGRDHKMPVVIVTGDRDSFQLVEDPYVRVLYNRRGVSDYSLYDEAGIFERCGIDSKRYVLLAALRGDTSDNLPGVPGVGEKTAAKLFAQFKDMDELYKNLAGLTPKLKENLASFEDRARNNVKLMTLVRDVPIDFTLEEMHMGGWDRQEVAAFFDRFEMNSMRARYEKVMSAGLLGGSVTNQSTVETKTKKTEKSFALKDAGSLAEVVAAEGRIVVSEVQHRVAVANEGNMSFVCADSKDLVVALKDCSFAGHNIKHLYREAGEMGAELGAPSDDTTIMAFLIDAISGNYQLADIAHRFLDVTSSDGPASLFADQAPDELLKRDISLVLRLLPVLAAEIDRLELSRVYREIELPLVAVLGRMEARGICVDRTLLSRISEEFAAEAAQLDSEIQKIAGHAFKVNSPMQLQVVLFEELKLTPIKKIKSGYSTDAASLEAIRDEHKIIDKILRYREVEKLRSTYGTSLIDSIGSDGRIHAVFNQTVARTGRLSSENPNLHNIPVRSADGRRLRYAFVPQEGWQLAVSDYNQIELRILAHLSQDSGLLAAFASGEDVHRTIAASVFGVATDKVSSEQREIAKAVSYGLAYGMEAFGLSQRLGISVGEAKSVMTKYFDGFPSLKKYMDDTIKEIRIQGFSRTEFGRIRPFPDLATAVGPQKAAAERQAMNAGIQGLAADIFKSALVRLDRALFAAGLKARLVLQVHDEVLVEAPPEEKEQVAAIMIEALTGAAALTVPLEVSLKWGENWAAAKG